MKQDIHPKYFPNCKVYHNGQVVMTVGATVPEMHVEVWSGSHPFFTGKHAFVDSAGALRSSSASSRATTSPSPARARPRSKRGSLRHTTMSFPPGQVPGVLFWPYLAAGHDSFCLRSAVIALAFRPRSACLSTRLGTAAA